MKLKYFFIALVAMVACFSEAFAQQVITVSNAEELKQALEGSLAPSTKRMAAAAATEATYPGSTYALGADVTDENIAYLMDSPMFNPLILDLNGFMVTGDLTIENGQLSIIDSKGTGAWIGCITVNSGATLAAGSGSIIAGESGVAVINNGTLSTDGGAVIGKITNNGDMPGVATYNTALVAKATVAQAALNVAIDGQGIQFAGDIEGDLTVTQKPNTKITIDGADNTLKGAITIDGKSARYETAGVTIKNLNFDATAITTDASINLGVSGNTNTRYTNHVTVENCTFTDNDYSAVAVKSYTGGDKNLVITNCKAEGMHSLVQLANVEEGLVIDGCTANTKNGINLGSSAGVQITNNTINVKGYAVRIGASSGGGSGAVTMTNNTLTTDNTEGDPVIVLRGTAPNQVDLKMSENSVSGNVHISGTTANTKISAEANYWDGKEQPVVAEGTPVVVNSYYTDAARTTLERNEMGSVNAFVSADRITGDVTHNAVNSLVIQILGADNNIIGTSTLENDTYRDGTKRSLTWRINLGADDSDSWKMEWADGAPSIDNMPAKVQVVVDGVALGEAEVKLTQNGDGQNPVFAAKTDAGGKILSFIVSSGFDFSKAAATLVSSAAEGDNIAILKEGTYTVPTGKNLTITGKVAGVKFDMSKAVGVHSSMTFNDVTFEYSTNKNYIGLQYAGTMVYNNCTIDGQVFLYGESETFNQCTFNQNSSDAYNVWTYGAKEVAFNHCTFNSAGKSVLIYAEGASIFNNVTVTGCTFNASTAVDGKAAIEMDSSLTGGINLTIDGTTATGFGEGNVSGDSLWNNKKGNANNANNDITVTVNGKTVLAPEYEAKIGETGHRTYQEALAAVQAGETITLLADVTTSEVTTINKNIIFDGNGKTLTYTGTNRAFDVPNNETADIDVTIKNLTVVATTANRGLNYNENGKFNVEGVTVTIGENVDGYAINFPGMSDNAQVTIKDSKLTSRNPLNIWGENMTIDVYDSEIISVDNSTTYDYAAIQLNNEIPTAGPNGAIANGTVVNVYGGKLTALNEKGELSNVVANATETGVVNISDETVITGKVLNYVANIGGVYFGSLQAAVNAIEEHGYNSPIVLMKDFATSEPTTIKDGLKVTLNLNGKTINGTDNETKSFGLITINPGAELTINGEGAVTLTATNNRGWNAYSSVISNQRGKLTVNGGTIEHLGGTDMAYAIDNLTNGKSTYAETIINGGTIKSTYRAIRQFLNGTEAQNILTVNAGTIEGANKSIWMQDANKNANSGSLTVADNAVLKGDVYLFVTAGSTEWPVEVSIADAAFEDGSTVITGNIPAQYIVENANGVWGKSNSVASVNGVGYATFAEAIAAIGNGDVVIELLADATFDYNARDAYGTAETTSVTINGNGNTLTLNQKNSDWASIGLANNSKLVLNNMTIEKTGYGDTSGAWNTHAIIFSCPVEMNGVTVNNSVAVQAGATLNNVDIVEANGYYGLWINGNGQTVEVNGGSITATNGGRGIKIADQYIDAPEQVTLNVTGTKFNTAKKAAVLVSSKAGASITASDVNIENVAEDKVNFVWVDEDWAQYFANVEVTGATVRPEGGEGSFAAAIYVDGAVQSYFKTFAKALEAVANGQTITLIKDVAENVTIKQVVGKNIAIDGNSKTYTGTITIDGQNKGGGNRADALTIKNVNFKHASTGISVQTTKNTYAHNITIDNCRFEGKNSTETTHWYPVVLEHAQNITFKNVTASGFYEFVYGKYESKNVLFEGVKVTECEDGFAIVYPNGITFKNVECNVAKRAVVLRNNSAGATTTFENCTINAATPVVLEEVVAKNYNLVFNGENQFTATNANGNWLTIEDDSTKNATFKVVANDTDLDFTKTSGLIAYAKNTERSFAYNNNLTNMVNETVTDDVVTLLADVTMDTKTFATQNDGYAVLLNVAEKAVTLDLNGKKVAVSAAAADLAAAKGKMLLSVFSADLGGDFTIIDSEGNGAVEVAVNDANVYSVFASESAQSDKSNSGKLTVNSGSFTTVGKVSNAMFFSDADEVITINGGIFFCDGASNTSGYPWFVNTLGNKELQVNVYGGTFNTDINHQYRPFEVFVPETLAVKSNGNGTWTIVPAQAYVTEMLGGVVNEAGPYAHKVGYATVADALAATNELGKTVTLVWSEGDAPIAMNGSVFGKDVTITGTAKVDWNKGFLFVGRGGEGNATVTFDGANLTSASNSNSYGIHVSGREKETTNKYDGTLVIKNSTIELDYLINRNAIELDNATFTVKNGFGIAGRPASETESGANATATISLANNSKVVVNNHNGMGLGQAASVLEGMGVMNIDETSTFETTQGFVVTANGTMNIAGQAIVAGTLTNNGVINLTTEEATLEAQEGLNIATTLPGYFVKYANGVYTVCGEIAFVDGEFTEYTNAADMVIKTLTYMRKFSTSWTPFYVPFEVPVSMLADKFNVARINDVRRTDNNNDGELDDFEMEIIFIHGGNADGSAKTLKPNYPYFIRSKSGQTETMEITLEDATLYAAKENVFDCTTMTEKFEIKGNNRKMLSNEFTSSDYIVGAEGWSPIADNSYLNPFRFYMTMSSRFEDEPAAPMKSMRITVRGEEDENGATIIYDVVEDNLNNNGNDFIYDLQGRRVSEPKKGGIYIKNGKKILY